MIKTSFFLVCLCAFSFNLTAITYESFSKGFFTTVHVLTVDPKEHSIRPVKALGENVTRETVAVLANRYGAVGAINGGFWKQNGDPAGILKIDYHWYGTPTKPRGAIGWSHDGEKVIIDKVLTDCDLVNCPNNSLIQVFPVSISPSTTTEEWAQMEHIVGGTPVLVSGGKLVENYASEQTLKSFIVKRHYRTAVGIKGNGEWVFVVVNGRLYGLLGGMTIKELAVLMFNLGCVDALNLDGGRSSTMVLNGVVVNKPYGSIQENGKQVPAVSDAILIF